MARERAQSFKQALEVLNTTVQPRLVQVGAALAEAKEKVADVTASQAARVDQEVRKNPWAFIGAATIVSLLIGFLLGRRSKR